MHKVQYDNFETHVNRETRVVITPDGKRVPVQMVVVTIIEMDAVQTIHEFAYMEQTAVEIGRDMAGIEEPAVKPATTAEMNGMVRGKSGPIIGGR